MQRAHHLQAHQNNTACCKQDMGLTMQIDYTFLDLETGIFSQLAEEQFLSFSDQRFNGSIPADNRDDKETVFPTYVALSSMSSPASKSFEVMDLSEAPGWFDMGSRLRLVPSPL